MISVAETWSIPWKAGALKRVCLVIRATLQAKLSVRNSQPLTQNEEYWSQNIVYIRCRDKVRLYLDVKMMSN